jgi:hypothetical protein
LLKKLYTMKKWPCSMRMPKKTKKLLTKLKENWMLPRLLNLKLRDRDSLLSRTELRQRLLKLKLQLLVRLKLKN